MAGTQNIGESDENPVSINITAMADVIFCLIVFFMCTFHFKQLEGKVETWLPRDNGNQNSPVDPPILEEIRVLLRWDSAWDVVLRKVVRDRVTSDAELMAAVRTRAADYERVGKKEFPVIIDATEDVPWQEVVRVMDLCKRENMAKIQFAEPMQYRAEPANR